MFGKRIRRFGMVAALMAALGMGFTACTEQATTSDMCAYTQGDGANGNDAKVHKVYYPNQRVDRGVSEKSFFFPCNARNLRFTPGSTDVNAKGEPISYIIARTNTGVEVRVELTAYWTLNQDRDVLIRDTIPLMAKSQAATSDPNVRNANFSTDGWSRGLLGENLTPKLQSTTFDVIGAMGDDVWKNPKLKADVAKKVSDQFMINVKAATGTTSDVFCGSGESSGWKNPDAPGADGNTYNCGNIRIDVTLIEPTDNTLLTNQAKASQADEEAATNEKILEAAKKKYGPDAGKYLAQQDAIKACKEAGMKVCSVGENGGVTVSTGSKE